MCLRFGRSWHSLAAPTNSLARQGTKLHSPGRGRWARRGGGSARAPRRCSVGPRPAAKRLSQVLSGSCECENPIKAMIPRDQGRGTEGNIPVSRNQTLSVPIPHAISHCVAARPYARIPNKPDPRVRAPRRRRLGTLLATRLAALGDHLADIAQGPHRGDLDERGAAQV